MESRPKKKQVEPGPELPTDESQAGVSYVDFEQLQQVDQDHLASNTDGFMSSLLESASSDDWKAQYEAINTLRSLNRYNTEVLVAYLDQFSKFVRSQVDNLRSNLSKNSLLFLKEFSANKQVDHAKISGFIAHVYPVALIKTIYEKNFIVVEAKQTFANAVENLLFPELIDTLVEGCRAKIITLAEHSIGYLTTLVKNFDPEYFNQGSQSVSLSGLINQLYQEYEGKRMKMKKGAESVFSDIKDKIGKERIEGVLIDIFSSQENAKERSDKIMKLFEEKTVKQADKSKDFRSFLKQQKQQAVKDEDENMLQ